MLVSRVAIPLLTRLLRSPYGGAWLAGARLGVNAEGERLSVSTLGVTAYGGEAVDAWLLSSAADLDAMLAGRAPVGSVSWQLGDRPDSPPRLQQARAALALAALGWCGPWPDPAADSEMVALTRRACFDLAVGPQDELRPLFSAGAPPELRGLALRFTDGARRTWATLGLSDLGGPEFVGLDPTWVRLAALHWWEARSVPARLTTEHGTFDFVASPLPLPHRLTALWRLERQGG